MPRVLLAGAFGQRNPGDDALLRAFSAALPGWQAVVPCENPDAVAAPDVQAIPNGPHAVLAALARSDAVAFAGGTVFKTLPATTGRRAYSLLHRGLVLARAARSAGRPVALAGVGAASLPDAKARAAARRLAAAADLLIVRDQASADVLAAAGVPPPLRVGADAAWTLFGDDVRPRSQPDRGPLVVSVSRHAVRPELVPTLAAGVARAVRGRSDVECVQLEPWQVGGVGLDDLDLARQLRSALLVAGELPVDVLAPPESIEHAAARYGGARALLGQRFHSVVAAGAAGCRFAAVGHEPKLADLAERLGQRSVRASASVTALAAAVREALDGPRPDARTVADLTRSAHAMLALTRVVVEGGSTGQPVGLRALRMYPEEAILR